MEKSAKQLKMELELSIFDPNKMEKTPDGKAYYYPIEYLEGLLDLHFGVLNWGHRRYETKIVGNEILGSIELYVIHPVTDRECTRIGTASVQIMVDALTDEEKKGMSKTEINRHYQNPDNKKPNALKLFSGVLKTECLKNAIISIAPAFGRNLNRDKNKKGTAKVFDKQQSEFVEAMKKITTTELKQMLAEQREDAYIKDFLSGVNLTEAQQAIVFNHSRTKKKLIQ